MYPHDPSILLSTPGIFFMVRFPVCSREASSTFFGPCRQPKYISSLNTIFVNPDPAMFSFNPIHEMITGFFTSKESQEAMRAYASSPEGKRRLNAYFARPEGQMMIRLLMPLALDHIDLPQDLKAKIVETLEVSR